MSFTYNRAQLKADVNAGIQNKQGILTDFNKTINQGVRQAVAEVDMSSMRRRYTMYPGLFRGIFDYFCPVDLKGYCIIDLPRQAQDVASTRPSVDGLNGWSTRDANAYGEFFLVPTEEFDRIQGFGMVAVDDYNGIRILKVASSADSNTLVISNLDSLTFDNTTWVPFGDAINLRVDNDDFIKGSASIVYDISGAGGTTAGIQANGFNPIDISQYLQGFSSLFNWAKIVTTPGVNGFTVRLGSSPTDYYEVVITVSNDGTAFARGWNLDRFDLVNMTTVGSPVSTAITYCALFMNKDITKINETDYKFDWIAIKSGIIHNLKYYSQYPWVDAISGAYKENSTADTDLIVAGSEEYECFIKACIAEASYELDLLPQKIEQLETRRDKAFKSYQTNNPSEAMVFTSEYFSYARMN